MVGGAFGGKSFRGEPFRCLYTAGAMQNLVAMQH